MPREFAGGFFTFFIINFLGEEGFILDLFCPRTDPEDAGVPCLGKVRVRQRECFLAINTMHTPLVGISIGYGWNTQKK